MAKEASVADQRESSRGARKAGKSRSKSEAGGESIANRASKSADPERDVPMPRVAFSLYVLIAVLGWCAMANAYHSETVGRPEVLETSSDAVSGLLMVVSMISTFFWSSFAYLPSVFSVLSFTFQNALSIPIFMLLACAAVYGLVHWTERVSADIAKGYQPSPHRRVGGRDERIARRTKKRR